MKTLTFFVVIFLWGVILFAEESVGTGRTPPALNWRLRWSGSWEGVPNNGGTLHNRGELRLNFPQQGLMLRSEILGRHRLDFDLAPPWTDPDRSVLNFNGGLYHRPTGSRLLAGVLNEWGLSARIRNPWIRSPPYADTHRPLAVDLRTTVSTTRKEEVYLRLASPYFNLNDSTRLRGFVSAQTELEEFKLALAGGLELDFGNRTGLLLEAFYTEAKLPPTKSSTWFANPAPLPERDFRLYAAGLRFNSPGFSAVSDWAVSETFAWGTDIYANLGIAFTPALAIGARARPLLVSFAVDGAGERFVFRDEATDREGFRCAGKIEWRAPRNALFRVNTVLRGPGLREPVVEGAPALHFNRSSSSILYRFPVGNASSFPVQLTRISITADRNAENPKKISDRLNASAGLSVTLPKAVTLPSAVQHNSLGINLSFSINGLTAFEGIPSAYPIPNEPWDFDSARGVCELVWAWRNFQYRARVGYTGYENKDGALDFSANISARFKRGRLSVNAASPKYPEKWEWGFSWSLEN